MKIESVKKTLKKFKDSKGLSRYRLAEISGIRQENIRALELNSKGTSYQNLVILCYTLFNGDWSMMGKALESELGKTEVNKIKARIREWEKT